MAEQQQVTYQPTIATMTNGGRAAIAASIKKQPLALAWGSGDPAWDATATEDLPPLRERTGLFHEVGRRTCEIVGFALPDEAGDIVVPVSLLPDGTVETARYRRVTEKSPYLYFKVNYDFADAATEVIRELGIFMDGTTLDTLPPGQRYFKPEQVVEPGDLVAIQIVRPPIARSPSTRQVIEFVLPI